MRDKCTWHSLLITTCTAAVLAGALTRLQAAETEPPGTDAGTALRATRPNVLFIAVDDLRPQLGCYGQSHMVTPRMDALAAGGTRFDRAYCMVPVCGASRASLMTSIRPSNNRFVNWHTRADRDAPDAIPLHTHFTQHGYHSVSLGKVFHHRDDHAEGWSEAPWRPNLPDERQPDMPDRYCDCYVLPESLEIERRHREQALRGPDALHRGPAYESADVPDEAYSDGKMIERAIADLRRLADKKQPFFLAVGFIRPHLPFLAPKRYWDLYDPADIRLPDNYRPPENCPPAALHTWGELRAYAGIPQQGPLTDETAHRLIHGYYACVSYVDALVGRLLDELERLGLGDETIVILWGDHGWQLGEHGLWCKHSCFETSMRAPLLIRAPGMPEGIACPTPVEFIDIYPTLCELADLPLPEHLEGASLVPLLRGEKGTKDRHAAVGRFQRGQTIRTERYRYTEYRDGQGRPIARMLYDHHIDPDETVNVAEKPAHSELIERLSAQLEANRALQREHHAEIVP